jgi:protein SCO1/2
VRAALLVPFLALSACRAAEPARPADHAFVPIPDVELVDQRGERVRFFTDLVEGRTVAVQFFFTDCQGICPLSTAKMLALQRDLGERLGRDVWLLSVTLDPENDTPEVLAEHAATLGAAAGWTFLTGSKEDIERLRRRLGVFDLDPVLDADRNQHAGVIVMGNEPDRRWLMKPANVPDSALVRTLIRLVEI